MKICRITTWLLASFPFISTLAHAKGKGKGYSAPPSEMPSPLPSSGPSDDPSSAPSDSFFQNVPILPFETSGNLGSSGIPLPAGVSDFCGISIKSLGLWFRANGDGNYVTAATIDGTNFDTRISVFSGDELEVCVGGNDDVGYPSDRNSMFTWKSENEKAFYILVHGYAGASGEFTLSLSSSPDRPIVSKATLQS